MMKGSLGLTLELKTMNIDDAVMARLGPPFGCEFIASNVEGPLVCLGVP
jgi:hypothetical protein